MTEQVPINAQSRRERQKAELRAELLAAAHALVKEEGYDGLTIRKLAKRVGYAPMSVYSYFADKHEILLALAEDAYRTLARRMEQDTPADPMAALHKMMKEYTLFALDNPNEYRTVFMTGDHNHPVGASDEEIQRIKEQNPAMQILLKRVQACIDAGIFKGDVHAISTLLWSYGHGTVSLLITFPHYPFGEREAFLRTSMDVALAGLTSREIGALTPPEEHC
jgi:AcrR family transcriptional regulator